MPRWPEKLRVQPCRAGPRQERSYPYESNTAKQQASLFFGLRSSSKTHQLTTYYFFECNTECLCPKEVKSAHFDDGGAS